MGCRRCALCLGHRRAPRLLFSLTIPDRFIILLVRAVATGSNIAWRRHPDPRIVHCFHLFVPRLVCCVLSSVNSPSLRTF